jgi:hypothetical protein
VSGAADWAVDVVDMEPPRVSCTPYNILDGVQLSK